MVVNLCPTVTLGDTWHLMAKTSTPDGGSRRECFPLYSVGSGEGAIGT